MMWLENLAERFLRWRGRVVLPRTFIGVAMGNAIATYHDDGRVTQYQIEVPSGFGRIVLNNSVLSKEQLDAPVR